MVFSYQSDLVLKINIVLILFTITLQVSGNNTNPTPMALYSCNFEVFGKVQGVFFRKYTEKQATTLGVRGWCTNTKEGTVKGELEAPMEPLHEMKEWLQHKGSPASKIEKVIFSPQKTIESYTFNNFSIRY